MTTYHSSICFLFSAASGAYFGISSSMSIMKSDFSVHPRHSSSQSDRMFFKSLTFSFFRFTVAKSTKLLVDDDISQLHMLPLLGCLGGVFRHKFVDEHNEVRFLCASSAFLLPIRQNVLQILNLQLLQVHRRKVDSLF